jgi:hypothetical protein
MRGTLLLLAALLAAAPGAAARATGSGNPTTDRLLEQPESQRVGILAGIAHHGCVGTQAFLMGVTKAGPARGTAYWSIACSDGKNYVIQINRDKNGTSFVADCKILEGSGRECFKNF